MVPLTDTMVPGAIGTQTVGSILRPAAYCGVVGLKGAFGAVPLEGVQIVRHGGACICAAVSPYRATRNECRATVGQENFVEVFVNTPLEVCESRDAKGMYRQAREGKIKNFTGVSDPYEPPSNPELVIDAVGVSAEENAARILAHLVGQGFVRAASEH